jgi:hypothetical protein
MNWEAFHHRGDVLHAVISELAVRRDGTLPMELPGVNETFRDDLDLIGALQLKWAARIQGWLEREFAEQPMDVEDAVIRAWRNTDAELAGVREVLDNYTAHPTSKAMADALNRARIKERTMLAANAGRLSFLDADEDGNRIGAEIEAKARDERHVLVETPAEPVPSLRQRLKAAFAA